LIFLILLIHLRINLCVNLQDFNHINGSMAKKKKGTKKNKKKESSIKDELMARLPVIKFIGGFFLFAIVFYLLTHANWFEVVRTPLIKVYTALSSILLSIFGYNMSSNGSILTNGAFSVDVQEGCDAVVPTILFITAVLVFPTAWKHKLRGLLFGVPALFAINLFRIITLFLTGLYIPSLFDFMHVEFWQALFILATVIIFIYWLRKSNVTA